MPQNSSFLILLAQEGTAPAGTAAPASVPAQTSTSTPAPDPGEEPPPLPKKSFLDPSFFVAIIIFMLAFIFLIDRPQKKKAAAAKLKAEEGIKKGTRVVSAGGIHGKVARTDKNKNTVFVTVANGLELEFNRSSVNIVADEIEAAPDARDSKDKK